MRLIDADALFVDASFFNDELDRAERFYSEEQIKNAPTIAAVEVVRCKECRHRDKEHSYMCTYLGDIVFDDGEGFCCKGERNIR